MLCLPAYPNRSAIASCVQPRRLRRIILSFMGQLVGLLDNAAGPTCARAIILSWIGGIRSGQRASRAGLTTKLKLLGWTDAAIGEVFKLTQQAINEITKKFNTELFGKLRDEWTKEKTIDITFRRGPFTCCYRDVTLNVTKQVQ